MTKIFLHNKINYYLYIQGLLNIQLVMKNKLFFNYLGQKQII